MSSSTQTTDATSTSDCNPRGIPKAPFIENIDQFVRTQQEQPDEILNKFREMFSKYRFMESHTLQRESVFVIDSAEKAKHKTDLSTEIGVKMEIIPYFILKKLGFSHNTLSLII